MDCFAAECGHSQDYGRCLRWAEIGIELIVSFRNSVAAKDYVQIVTHRVIYLGRGFGGYAVTPSDGSWGDDYMVLNPDRITSVQLAG